jgi:hypothetical protein
MNKEVQNNATENRRSFLKETGKKALWAAPVVTVMMTASAQRAKASTDASGTKECVYTTQ